MKEYKNGSSYQAIDKKFSMQGMFMRFYGLETIHSNDKNGSRCENGKRMCEYFLFDCSLYFSFFRHHRHRHHLQEGDEEKKYGREKYYCMQYHTLHILVFWELRV